MKLYALITIVAGCAVVAAASQIAAAGAQEATPEPTSVPVARVVIRVVYDINNNGTFDPEDPELTGRDAVLGPSGQGSAVESKGGTETDVPAGTYTVFAIGPQYFPGEEGKPDAVCRGWRTSYIVGAPLSKTGEQPLPGLGFTVDLPATDAASPPSEIVLGLSDKGQKGTEFADVQILCPLLGGTSASLPAAGSGQGAAGTNWRPLLLVVALVFGFATLCMTRLARRRSQ